MSGTAAVLNRSDRVGRRILLIGLAALLPLMVALSRDYGVTWDELPRQAYGERIARYYRGEVGIERFPADGSHLYGGLFELSAVGMQELLPFDKYDVRHGLNAAFGWLGIVGCALVAARLGGPGAGVLAMALAATAPRYLGHSMNNPKDVPFAALAAMTLVGLFSIRTRYPYLPLQVTAGLGVAIGLSLAVRPGGVLFLAYTVGLVVLVLAVRRERNFRRLAVTGLALVMVVAVATTLPLPFWPWLRTRPYVGLVEAVRGVSHFEWHGSMLFDGRDVSSTDAPWTYVPVWLWYTTPPVVIAGAALSLVRLRRGLAAGLPVLGLWFTVAFPVAYVVARNSTIYDEVRHLLFIMPSLFLLAALGWRDCLVASHGWRRHAAAAVLLLGLAEPLAFILRNHPHEVVYFNPLLGGPRDAVGRFELDYWGNCHYEAMRKAAALAREAGTVVAISGRRWRQMALNASRIPEVHVPNPDRGLHHLDVRLVRGPRDAVRQLIREAPVVYTIATADGAPLCLVIPGPAYPQLAGRLERSRSAAADRLRRE